MPDAPLAKPRLRIGFVHRFDARNIRSWSGAFFFMAQALQNHVGDVVYLGPDASFGTKFIIDNVARINRISKRLTGKTLVTDHNRILSKRLGRFFSRRLHESPCDILFAPVASVEIASLETNLPIVYQTDITWAAIVGYYPEFSEISAFGKAEGERIESAALARAKASVFPSNWAAESARNHYGVSPSTVYQIPFGANLKEPPSRASALRRALHGRINLLLVGVDWERKGGAIAYDCLLSLLDRGVDAYLTVLGCVAPAQFKHPRLCVIPFLNKNDPEHRKQINQLYLDAHFMLLPTRAEGLGIVTCEASAFGLPTLAADTGGVRGSLNDGVNGFVLPFDAPGGAYADKIAAVIADPAHYLALVLSSRNEYERSLNWDAWACSIRSVMEQALDCKIPVPEHFDSEIPGCESESDALDLSETLAAEVSRI